MNLIRELSKTEYEELAQYLKTPEFLEILKIIEKHFDKEKREILLNLLKDTHATASKNWKGFADIIGYENRKGSKYGFLTHEDTSQWRFRELAELVKDIHKTTNKWTEFAKVIGKTEIFGSNWGFCAHKETLPENFKELIQLVRDVQQTASKDWDGFARVIGSEHLGGVRWGFCTHRDTTLDRFKILTQLVKDVQQTANKYWEELSSVIGKESEDRVGEGYYKTGFFTHKITSLDKFKELAQLTKDVQQTAGKKYYWGEFAKVIGLEYPDGTKRGFRTHRDTTLDKFKVLTQLVRDTQQTAKKYWSFFANIIGYRFPDGTKVGLYACSDTTLDKLQKLTALTKGILPKIPSKNWHNLAYIIGYEDINREKWGFVTIIDSGKERWEQKIRLVIRTKGEIKPNEIGRMRTEHYRIVREKIKGISPRLWKKTKRMRVNLKTVELALNTMQEENAEFLIIPSIHVMISGSDIESLTRKETIQKIKKIASSLNKDAFFPLVKYACDRPDQLEELGLFLKAFPEEKDTLARLRKLDVRVRKSEKDQEVRGRLMFMLANKDITLETAEKNRAILSLFVIHPKLFETGIMLLQTTSDLKKAAQQKDLMLELAKGIDIKTGHGADLPTARWFLWCANTTKHSGEVARAAHCLLKNADRQEKHGAYYFFMRVHQQEQEGNSGLLRLFLSKETSQLLAITSNVESVLRVLEKHPAKETIRRFAETAIQVNKVESPELAEEIYEKIATNADYSEIAAEMTTNIKKYKIDVEAEETKEIILSIIANNLKTAELYEGNREFREGLKLLISNTKRAKESEIIDTVVLQMIEHPSHAKQLAKIYIEHNETFAQNFFMWMPADADIRPLLQEDLIKKLEQITPEQMMTVMTIITADASYIPKILATPHLPKNQDALLQTILS